MGYRSMLSSVFRFKLPKISSSPVLQDLLRSFKVGTPSRVFQPPSWDLNKVLNHLRSSTYEPLANLSLRCLTKKVLFLLSLATANELGSYRRSFGWSRFLIWALLYHMSQNSWPRRSLPCDSFLAPSWSSLSRILLWVRCELVVMPYSQSPRICWRAYGVDFRPLRLFVLLKIRSRSINKGTLFFSLGKLLLSRALVQCQGWPLVSLELKVSQPQLPFIEPGQF